MLSLSVPIWAWAAFVAGVLLLLAVDLVAHRDAHVPSTKEAAAWSAVWISIGLGFGVAVWAIWGSDAGSQYLTAWVLEKSLAVDNVFVFTVILTSFAVPRELQHRVLFFGVIGALVFRAIFIALGSVAIDRFAWVLPLFGAFLLYAGIKLVVTKDAHSDPTNSRAVRWVRRRVPMTEDYHGQHFVIRQAGRWVATPLLLVLVTIEVSDIIFAVDSIPAVFGVTRDPFLVFTSNALAVLGLRALYFLLADAVHRFRYLPPGLALVLVLIGVKMLITPIWHVPSMLSLGMVLAVLGLRALYFLLADAVHRFRYLPPGLALVLVLIGVKMLITPIWHVPSLLSLGMVLVVLGGSIALSVMRTRRADAAVHEPDVDEHPAPRV